MHEPVLLQETMNIFKPIPGQRFVDATANGGGHTFAIWESVKPTGRVLAIDKDPALIKMLTKKSSAAKANIIAVQGSYVHLRDVLQENNMEHPDGIVFDLGYSSYHIEEAGRGFSFQKDEPLDMRYDPNTRESIRAQDVVNRYPEEELGDIIFRYGEERYARRIARAVCQARQKKFITTSTELSDIVRKAIPRRNGGNIHPATQTFQALRIFVNHELEELERVIPLAIGALGTGGMIIIISFHSLEDRIVKHIFRTEAQNETIQILNKKPLQPSLEEIRKNPRARSAKLRAAKKL